MMLALAQMETPQDNGEAVDTSMLDLMKDQGSSQSPTYVGAFFHLSFLSLRGRLCNITDSK
jgi:hypothetical protein